MSMAEPFVSHSHQGPTIAAADPGPGAPDTAPGFGVEGEEPDVTSDDDDEGGEDEQPPSARPAAAEDPPFRTPAPDRIGRSG